MHGRTGGRYSNHVDVLTIAITGYFIDQGLDLNGERGLLIKLLLGLANVLAYAGPQLHFLIVAEAIISRPGAIARHVQSDPGSSGFRTRGCKEDHWGLLR